MWEKLKQLARRYDEIGELLEVPEIYADPKKLRALTREQKELSAVVETYRAYQKCEDDIVQALELVSDPELKDMAGPGARRALPHLHPHGPRAAGDGGGRRRPPARRH